MQKLKNNQGFTIIEVVLVLAIAGLIFLMIFIALPALQRSQADTQRRSDAGRVLSSITNYQTNNRGQVPTEGDSGAGSFGQFVTDYMTANGDQFNDPSGDQYGTGSIPFMYGIGDPDTTPGSIRYAVNATCSGGTIASGSGSRKVAVAIRLTSGIYCTNN